MNSIAVKFIRWEAPPLETLSGSRVYLLRSKLNRGERMTRSEKDFLAREVNRNSYFNRGIPLCGYHFDFSDVLQEFLVRQYGCWCAYYAPDKTSLRKILYGRIERIVTTKSA